MTNVEKLEAINILGDVRQRLGAEDENDTSQDEKINTMNNSSLIAKYCGWNLGDEVWWSDMFHNFNELESMDKA